MIENIIQDETMWRSCSNSYQAIFPGITVPCLADSNAFNMDKLLQYVCQLDHSPEQSNSLDDQQSDVIVWQYDDVCTKYSMMLLIQKCNLTQMMTTHIKQLHIACILVIV